MNWIKDFIDFVRKVYDQPEGFIPLHEPRFNGNEKKYINECIDSTFVSSVGKFVDEFEIKTAEFTGAKKAVVCVNGTNALYLALELSGIQEGDEVITQALTFIATANAISYCRAHPIFLDVDRDTLGLSPEAVNNWLVKNARVVNGVCYNKTTGNRIKACVPMHTFGHPIKMDELISICNQYNIEVVEDAAESIGSYYKGKHTGTFGKVGVLSFNGNKTITTGGGGMLLFNDEALAAKAKHLTTQAKVPHKWEFRHDHIGYNYRMPNINAALGLAQLEQLPGFLENKRKLSQMYDEYFSSIGVNYFKEPKNSTSSYWLNAIVLENREVRDIFLTLTNDAGVMTRPVWELMNRLLMFKDCQTGDLSNAQWLADRIVNIPSSVVI